jgi:CopG family nickel-responsive transcriptional regulator
MERLTISVSEEFAAELAAFMRSRGYDNRSEALRDLAGLGLKQARTEGDGAGECIATLSYVYNHQTRELPKRLTETHHARHDLHVATMHVHLDHENCLEVAVLRGDAAVVRDLANTVVTERGVNHGALSIIPVMVDSAPHAHGPGVRHHAHDHIHPRA